MTKPSRFLLNSDYRTLKVDGVGNFIGTLPPSTVIAAGATWTFNQDVEVGAIGALSQVAIGYNSPATAYYFADSITFTGFTGTSSGSPAPYSILVVLSRISPTTMRFSMQVLNPYGATLTTDSSGRTISATAATYIAPYA